MKSFLKRFEKLENNPSDLSVPKEKLSGTRRFERLEIDDRKIEISIADRAAKEETAPAGTLYYRMCPYCGAENRSNVEECAKCRHRLGNYAADYDGKEGQLKKCVCGAVNLKERKFCWVCGRDFSLWGDEKLVQKQQNIVVITLDGTTYRSDDPNLPPGIVALMEKIRRQGYSKELIDEWVKNSNESRAERTEEITQNIFRLKYDVLFSLPGAVALIFIVVFLIWASLHSH